jgi:hypothetical protein
MAVLAPSPQRGPRRFRLLAGPLGGPLTPLNASVMSDPLVLDWAGPVLVAQEGDGRTAVVNARDPASGFAPRPLPVAPGGRAMEAAGSFIASLTSIGNIGETSEQLDARIDVIGLDGSAVYSATAEDSFIWDYAVQDDGKVAWIERRNVEFGPGTLAWASPAEPWKHVIATDLPTAGLPIGFGRDRIVFSRRVGPRMRSWQPWVAGLDGSARRTWFPVGPGQYGMRSDFDGDRLAIAAGGCVFVGDVGRALPGPPGGACPQAVTDQGRRQARRGGSRYAYTFPCVMGPPGGCSGIARYEIARRERGRRKLLAVRRFRVAVGERTTVHFRVSRERLRRERNRAGTIWTFISVRSKDRRGRTSVTESVPLGVVP